MAKDNGYHADRVGCWVQRIQMACTRDNHIALLREIVGGIQAEALQVGLDETIAALQGVADEYRKAGDEPPTPTD